MITITFKNVGQGDSIILEWERNGKSLIGIIDCKKNEDDNPILEYVIEKGYRKIEFLLLSHPHLDHCSGFVDLIRYCLNNDIRIGYFLHTGANTSKYWKDSLDTTLGSDYLLDLYSLLRDAYKAGKILINSIEVESMNPQYIFARDLFMQIMAPTPLSLINGLKMNIQLFRKKNWVINQM